MRGNEVRRQSLAGSEDGEVRKGHGLQGEAKVQRIVELQR